MRSRLAVFCTTEYRRTSREVANSGSRILSRSRQEELGEITAKYFISKAIYCTLLQCIQTGGRATTRSASRVKPSENYARLKDGIHACWQPDVRCVYIRFAGTSLGHRPPGSLVHSWKGRVLGCLGLRRLLFVQNLDAQQWHSGSSDYIPLAKKRR